VTDLNSSPKGFNRQLDTATSGGISLGPEGS
jgi:hypothetical protein